MKPFLIVGDDLASLVLASLLRTSHQTILLRSSSRTGISVGSAQQFPILPAFTLAAPAEFPAVPARISVTLGSDSYALPSDNQRLLEYLCDVLLVPPRVVLALSRSPGFREAFGRTIASLIPPQFLPFFESLLLPLTHAPFPYAQLRLVSRLISGHRPAFYSACAAAHDLLQGVRSEARLIEDEAVSASPSPGGSRMEVRTAGGGRLRPWRTFWGASRFADLYAAPRSSRLLPCILYATLEKDLPVPGVEIIRPDPDLPPWGDNFCVISILPFERGFSRFSAPRLIAYSIWSHRKWALALRQGPSPAKSLVDRVVSRFPSASIHRILTPAEYEVHPLRHTALWGSFKFADVSWRVRGKDPRFSPPGITLGQAGYPEADIGAFIAHAIDIASALRPPGAVPA
jgi:hypothetical protein